MSADDQLVQVGRLLGGELMEAQVVQDEQVWREKGPESPVQGVVDSGLGHGPEEVVGMEEADGVTGPDGREAEGLGEEGLADTGGPTSRTCSCLERNSSENTASRSLRSRVMAAVQSKLSRRQVYSNPAERTLSSTRRFSRLLTSSLRMISRKEA